MKKQKRYSPCLLWALLLAFAGSAKAQTTQDFTIIVLPDIQNYSSSTLQQQMTWIRNNASSRNIRAVIGEGDNTNDGSDETRWRVVDQAISILDSSPAIPYILPMGNHDYGQATPPSRDATLFNKYFGPTRYRSKDYGWYQDGWPQDSQGNVISNENSLLLLDPINGRYYAILSLEFYPRAGALEWAKRALDAVVQKVHTADPGADVEVIVTTHSFVNPDNASRVAPCEVDDFGVGSDNHGDEIWYQLLYGYPAVSLVLNGHFNYSSGYAVSRRADLGHNGNLVNQLQSDFQGLNNGNSGYLRIMTFHPASNSVDVETYSPSLKQGFSADPPFQIQWHAAAPPQGQTGAITGLLRRRPPNCAVIANHTVSIGGTKVQTDGNGRFSLSGLPSGQSYLVTAEADSSLAADSEEATVYSGQPAFVKLFMADVTSCTAPSSPGVNICSPANGSSVTSPFTVSAVGRNSNTTSAMDVWLDGKKFGWYGNTTVVNVGATAAAGSHQLDIYAVGVDGELKLQKSLFTVVSGSGSCPVPDSPGVIICAPASGSTYSSPVRILASGRVSTSTTGMDVWIDGTKFGWYGNTQIVDVTANLSAGNHQLGIYAVGTNGELEKTIATFSIAASTTCAVPSSPGVNICAPANGATVPSPVRIWAAGRDNSTTAGIDVWLDGRKVGWYTGNTVDTNVPNVAAGAHQLEIYAVGNNGELQKAIAGFSVTVSSTNCPLPLSPGVNICSPLHGATVGTTVRIFAAGRASTTTAGMDVWLDGRKVGWYASNTVDINVPNIAPGSHQLDIYAVGVNSELQKGTVYFTVI